MTCSGFLSSSFISLSPIQSPADLKQQGNGQGCAGQGAASEKVARVWAPRQRSLLWRRKSSELVRAALEAARFRETTTSLASFLFSASPLIPPPISEPRQKPPPLIF